MKAEYVGPNGQSLGLGGGILGLALEKGLGLAVDKSTGGAPEDGSYVAPAIVVGDVVEVPVEKKSDAVLGSNGMSCGAQESNGVSQTGTTQSQGR